MCIFSFLFEFILFLFECKEELKTTVKSREYKLDISMKGRV